MTILSFDVAPRIRAISATGHITVRVDDDVAAALEGISIEGIIEIAENNDWDNEKFGPLNNGLKRMTVGQRLRTIQRHNCLAAALAEIFAVRQKEAAELGEEINDKITTIGNIIGDKTFVYANREIDGKFLDDISGEVRDAVGLVSDMNLNSMDYGSDDSATEKEAAESFLISAFNELSELREANYSLGVLVSAAEAQVKTWEKEAEKAEKEKERAIKAKERAIATAAKEKEAAEKKAARAAAAAKKKAAKDAAHKAAMDAEDNRDGMVA